MGGRCVGAGFPVPYSVPGFSSVTIDAKTRATAIVAGLSADEGAAASAEELLPLVYDDLRRRARVYMRRERHEHTLQPTALVHEAYLKLVDQSRVSWRGRSHFFAVGARIMRRLLIDHARGRQRGKRGGGSKRVTLAEELAPAVAGELSWEDLWGLNAALEKLAHLDERQARIVELRFFGGLKTAEVAQVLGVSRRTVAGDWAHAKAWLRRELTRR